MQAINSHWTATMAPIIIMTRQKLISYRGIAAQPSTNSQCQTSPLGMILKKNSYLDYFFSSLGFRAFKSISRNAYQFPLPTTWANLISILRYTEGFSFTLWLPSAALHTCTRAGGPTGQPRGFPDGLLKEATKKPAEHYRIYKNRKRRITIMDTVVLSSLHLSSDDKAQSTRSVPTTQVTLSHLITWCVTKPEIKFSCSRKAALLRFPDIKYDLRSPCYLNSDKERNRSDIFFVSGFQSMAQSCSQTEETKNFLRYPEFWVPPSTGERKQYLHMGKG